MLKGGPLLPIDFKTIYFSEEERKCWYWYVKHPFIVALAIIDHVTYGFNRLGEYKLVTPMGTESKWCKGTWLEYEGTLCMDREELHYYV